MYKLYMCLWWLCLIQWPLFILWTWAGASKFFNFPTKSLFDQLETYIGAYMVFLAPYMVLPAILTIILMIRYNKGIKSTKLEDAVASFAWLFSLLIGIPIILQGGFRT